MGAYGLTERRADLVRRAMRISITEGAFATGHLALTSGAFFTGFALLMGADDAALGVLAAIPYLGQVFQLLSAYLTEKTARVKAVTFVGGAGSRLSWVFPIILLFLPGLSVATRVGVLVAFFLVSYGLYFVSYNAWTSWMSDLIPERLRGRYFGVRNVVVVIVSLIVTLAGGVALDAFQRAGSERVGFAVLFGVAVAAAAVSVALILKQPALPAVRPALTAFWTKVRAPLLDGNFRRILAFFAAWNGAWGLALAFWNVHMLEYLGMSYFQVSLFGVFFALSSVAGNRAWGRLMDRAGNKPVAFLSAASVAAIPLIWLAPRPAAIWPIWVIAFFAGGSWAGLNLAAFTFPLALAPRAGRVYYIAVFGIVTGVAAFVASVVGGLIAQAASPYVWTVGGVEFINYHLLFVLSALGRAASILLLRRVREVRAAGVRATVAFIGDALHERLVAAAQFFPGWIRIRPRDDG